MLPSLQSQRAVTRAGRPTNDEALCGRREERRILPHRPCPGGGEEVKLRRFRAYLAGAVCAGAAAGASADPVVPGYRVETYAHAADPVTLSFGAQGVLYVGRDLSGAGGGALDATRIHRIAGGGTTTAEFGQPVP
ncbi:MAG: hypothetical protein D6744_18600, partial [Planctomycetota bacterium]